MTYLSTTTVMQSVATINSDVNHGIYKNRECCSVDAYNYLTELVLSQIVKTFGPMLDLDPYTKYMINMSHQS